VAIAAASSITVTSSQRKEYIESLEKRTSELCSENAMLDLSGEAAQSPSVCVLLTMSLLYTLVT
jgi:hypothetical protein